MAKLNLEELVARATQSKADKLQVRMVVIDQEGNTIQATKKDLRTVAKTLDMETETTNDRFQAEMKLVYDHCQVLHEKELQAAYGCVEPLDAVEKVFDSNMGLIEKAAKKILDMYGLAEEEGTKNPVDDVKN
ncbi:phage portal protein [Anaerotignum lactatifermentans]|uniref:phage portal protein n=1 Tax=Anaerotignum lactatifermentans TaxID=160404 RepID=UPI001875BA1A|nr:phage portal protein [Anaerotignum lactatifermentans]MBE5076518.1 phage portal protein [Anaerotignum lactatifermentans]